jgi:crotonobetainyl-CoA:carnitine CoA-transferase CaiB-like acyl-CoA transferase
MAGPLDGIRVIEAAQMVAGPLAAMLLSDQGADVVKIENADGVGDRFRFVGTRHKGIGAAFGGVNRGKRSVVLDLKDERGRDAARRLIDGADVFLQNFRPGVAERLGLGPDEMLARNPGLVYTSVSGFGPTGPYREQMVYDFVIQAKTGIAALQGDLVKTIVVDKVTAYTVAQAITAALLARERGAGGQHLQLNMLDVGLSWFWPDGMVNATFLDDEVTVVGHMADGYEVRPTLDGHVALLANGNRTWPRLCAALEPAWLDDPRFATMEDRLDRPEELGEAVNGVLAGLTTEEVLSRLRKNDLPGAAVTPLEEVHLDPQVIHNESLVEHDWPTVGRVREPKPAPRFGATPAAIGGRPPRYGEHTEEVLAAAGYADDEIAAFRAAGVLG